MSSISFFKKNQYKVMVTMKKTALPRKQRGAMSHFREVANKCHQEGFMLIEDLMQLDV